MAANPKSSRRVARELAVRAIYADLCGGGDPLEKEKRLSKQADMGYLQRLLAATLDSAKIADLDTAIAAQSARQLSEIDRMELSILRLACHELQAEAEVPVKVVLNESIRLARLYCGPESYRFINGITDRMATLFRQQEMRNL